LRKTIPGGGAAIELIEPRLRGARFLGVAGDEGEAWGG